MIIEITNLKVDLTGLTQLLTYYADVHQNDRVHSVETLLSPLSHPPLSAKSSTANLVATPTGKYSSN